MDLLFFKVVLKKAQLSSVLSSSSSNNKIAEDFVTLIIKMIAEQLVSTLFIIISYKFHAFIRPFVIVFRGKVVEY